MKQFEGNINGKTYTNEKEFNKALFTLDSDDVYVSYRYVTVPDTNNNVKTDSGVAIGGDNNYVDESQYVKNITNAKDVELDAKLMNKLKSASNKLDINETVSSKIISFDNKISDNLLHINELKTDCKKLEDAIKLYNSQIKNLTDANNNYYLNKEYYTNIKNLLDTPVDIPETKCVCNCDPCECKCENKNNNDALSLKDIYDMSPYELAKYLNKRKIYTLADLVEYFLKN